jgi:predicted ATP-grasp superfamily ATP-dependent carboligase
MIRMGGSNTRTILIYEHVTAAGPPGSYPASILAEGRAMRRALAADYAAVAGVRVVVILSEHLPDDPGPWEIVRSGDDRGSAFDSQVRRADLTVLIAPERGMVLMGLAIDLELHGNRSLGPTSEAIGLAGHKAALGRHLRSLGVATPECRLIEYGERLPEDFSYPAVLKPMDGAGSIDTFLIDGPDALHPKRLLADGAVIQPYIPGEPMSATFLVAPDGRALLVGVGRQRIEIQAHGRIVYRGGIIPAGLDPSCDEARRAVAAVPGLRGLVGVDFIRDPATGRDTIIEINPRPMTSVVGLCRLLPPGALAAAWLAAADGTLAESVDLAALVHAQRPLAFEPDGTIFPSPTENCERIPWLALAERPSPEYFGA